MLKHKFIIDRLSESQKIRILTDVRCLADEEYSKLGIPSFALASADGFGTDFYPSAKSLASSWSSRVVSEVATDIAVSMSARGINAAIVPSPVAKLNINDEATTEDPYLSTKLTSEYVYAIGKTGMGAVVDGAYLDENDVSRLDKRPDSRLINEFVLRPIEKSFENKKCNGVIVSSDIDVRYYEGVNSEIAEKITVGEGRSYQGSYILCKDIAPEDTVKRIVKGHICLDGSETMLKAAIDRYNRLTDQISRGKVSICELEAEIENGSAFSPERIDEALDKVLEFVFDITKECSGRPSAYTPNNATVKNAACESTVLLKNNGVLPLKGGSVVALLGDILVNYSGDNADNSEKANELLYYIGTHGCSATGFRRGYSMCEARSEGILNDATSAIVNTETVLIFMGTNPKIEAQMKRTGNLHLPANQIALVEKMHSMGKKVIAVVSSDLSFDVSFDSLVDALIVAPLNTRYGAEAVIDVVTGRFAPSGRLASTLYRNTDLIRRKQGFYLNQPGARVGTFVGYRYYDTADYDPAYPFGFGLGYTSFQYSNLTLQGNDAIFTLKNDGSVMGTEVVQLYVGMGSTKRCRPKKVLVGFEKITLMAGASTTVRIPIMNLASYDQVSEQWLCEQGEYTVYIGSSVRDIALTGKMVFGNATLDDIGERASDYLQSETNIISDRYTLEADYNLMKRELRNIIFGTGALALAVTMFLFSLISGIVGPFLIAVSVILAIAGVVLFALEGSDRSKLHKIEREKIDEANKASFENAQPIDGFSTSRIFADEFDMFNKDTQQTYAPAQAKVDNYLEFVNDSLTFDIAYKQFIAFASSRGYRVEANTAKELFSAMSASRLVVTYGMTNDSFSAFIKVFSEYFGTTAGIDAVDSTYVNDHKALFKTIGMLKQKTALAGALEASGQIKEKVHIAALTDVTLSEISNYFIPFSRYIRNPRNSMVIETKNENGDTAIFRPFENIWFFVNLRMGESIKNMPAYLAELASVVRIDYTGAVPTMLANPTMEFNYYQFDYMLDKVKTKNVMTEEYWKKVDALEAFVKNNASYALSNRACIAVEKFYAVFSACGADEKEALDRALAARVIPSTIIALDSVEGTENKNLSEKLDMIFGDGNVENSRSMIRSAGSTVL